MNTSSKSLLLNPSSSAVRHEVRRLSGVRWSLLVAALALAAAGVATVASATAEWSQGLASRQALWVALGLLALIVVLTFDYHVLMDLATPLYGLGLAALVLVLAIGEERSGARSWLGIGSLGGQPSEYMKLATVLFAARYLALSNQRTLGWRQLLGCGALAAPPMLLVALEPDLGGALMFVPSIAGMLLVAGVRWRTMVGVGAVGVALAAGLFFLWR